MNKFITVHTAAPKEITINIDEIWGFYKEERNDCWDTKIILKTNSILKSINASENPEEILNLINQ